jgi:DNA polymerase (family 10)
MSVITTAYRESINLAQLSKRLEIAGSIRRNKPEPNDVDIVLTPVSIQQIMNYVKRYPAGNTGRGNTHASYRKNGIEIELYFATPQNWGAMLMYVTGSNEYNILLRKYAKFFGMKLSQYGLFERESGKKIAGESEQSIYEALGKRWKPPERRGIFR